MEKDYHTMDNVIDNINGQLNGLFKICYDDLTDKDIEVIVMHSFDNIIPNYNDLPDLSKVVKRQVILKSIL